MPTGPTPAAQTHAAQERAADAARHATQAAHRTENDRDAHAAAAAAAHATEAQEAANTAWAAARSADAHAAQDPDGNDAQEARAAAHGHAAEADRQAVRAWEAAVATVTARLGRAQERAEDSAAELAARLLDEPPADAELASYEPRFAHDAAQAAADRPAAKTPGFVVLELDADADEDDPGAPGLPVGFFEREDAAVAASNQWTRETGLPTRVAEVGS